MLGMAAHDCLTRRGERSNLAGMRPTLASALVLAFSGTALPCSAQVRLSEKGVSAQTVGNTTITVEYHRPVARGRDSLFGKVVKWGEHWTPGANWASTIDVDHDVRVEGQLLPKGKYSIWTIVRPDSWTLQLHRRARLFHLARPDSTDRQLEVTVKPASSPQTDILTFDFPEVATGATTLRLRWGTVAVPIHLSMVAPPLKMLATSAARARYLGRYDLELLEFAGGTGGGRFVVDVTESGDTLFWRDVDRPAPQMRVLVMSPGPENDSFTRARRASDGQWWTEGGIAVYFKMANGRADGFEVQIEDGTVVSRAKRRP